MNQKLNILIIDDSESSLMLIEWVLENEGYSTNLANSVEEAIKYIQTTKPDLIFLDLQMPDVSGYDFLKMRQTLQIGNVPIVIISAYDTEENISLTKNMGAVEFIPKPLKSNKILDIVNKYFPKNKTIS